MWGLLTLAFVFALGGATGYIGRELRGGTPLKQAAANATRDVRQTGVLVLRRGARAGRNLGRQVGNAAETGWTWAREVTGL